MQYKKNDIVVVTIEDIGQEGEGIGKIDGFPFFIKNAVIGDIVEAKVMKCKKNYAYARLEKLKVPSFFRTKPKCPFYQKCGGCQIQALTYEKQLEFKYNKVRNNIVRIGGFEENLIDTIMEPIIGMEEPFQYRNKAQYPVGTDKEGNLIAGFYAGHTHSIIANTSCSLGVPENGIILKIILDYMKKNKVSAYQEQTGEGVVRHILIRKGFVSGQIMVCLVIHQEKPSIFYNTNKEKKHNRNQEKNGKTNKLKEFLPNQEELLSKLMEVKGMTSILVNINNEKTNVIMGQEVYFLLGDSTIKDTIHIRNMKQEGYPFTGKELTFKISPLSFYQVNPIQTEKLYSLALEYAELTGEETVWDLYCGIGTISLFLSQKAKQVYGVEVISQAIENAKENAKLNQIHNVQFFTGKAEEILPEKYKTQGIYADVIVIDPPRKGCDEICLSTILSMQPKRIVYISCDSATLARDLKVLCDGGYELKKIRALDLFPQTVHVETIVGLQRRDM